ncbi:glycosyltransferase [Pontimonas sp.]|nr:glycosyltransferase [Pontimonas sp.]MDA9116835.1 glycosyltransferase [Pontimonas sp.]
MITLPHLRIGGAQKQAVLLAEMLTQLGSKVVIVLVNAEKSGLENALYRLAIGSGVQVKLLRGVGHTYRLAVGARQTLRRVASPIRIAVRGLLKRLSVIPRGANEEPSRPVKAEGPGFGIRWQSWWLRRLVMRMRPDIIISMLTRTNVIALRAAVGICEDIVVSERNDLNFQPVNPTTENLRDHYYPLSSEIIANSEATSAFLRVKFASSAVFFVPNLLPPLCPPEERKPDGRVIGIVARAEPQKNIAQAIDGFLVSGLWKKGWSLRVFSSGGSHAAELSKLADSARDRNVTIVFGEDDQNRIYADLDYTILFSEYEGTPNVYYEAIAGNAFPLVTSQLRSNPQIQAMHPDLWYFEHSPAGLAEKLIHLAGDDHGIAIELASIRMKYEHQRENYNRQVRSFLSRRAGEVSAIVA